MTESVTPDHVNQWRVTIGDHTVHNFDTNIQTLIDQSCNELTGTRSVGRSADLSHMVFKAFNRRCSLDAVFEKPPCEVLKPPLFSLRRGFVTVLVTTEHSPRSVDKHFGDLLNEVTTDGTHDLRSSSNDGFVLMAHRRINGLAECYGHRWRESRTVELGVDPLKQSC